MNSIQNQEKHQGLAIFGDKVRTKALPSSPVWQSLTIDFGFWNSYRNTMYQMMSVYQKNALVHGCIDKNAKAIISSNPSLMRVVNQGAKNLESRGLKRLSQAHTKRLHSQIRTRGLQIDLNEDEEELVSASNHQFWEAIDNPIQNLYFEQRLRLSLINYDIYGIAFWIKQYDQAGTFAGYAYVPTYNMLPNRGANGEVINWYHITTMDGVPAAQPLDLDDVLMFRDPSPTDPVAGGDSPVLAAMAKIGLSQKWLDHQDALISNRARPDWMFIPKTPDNAPLTPEQAQAAEKSVNDKFRGQGNGRVGIARQPGTAIPLNFTPTDLAPLAFDEQLEKALLFVLGIPEAFTKNDGSHTNLEAAMEQWARQRIAPTVNVFEKVLTREAKSFDNKLVFIFENVIPEDEEFGLEKEKLQLEKWQVGLANGGLQNNDYRVNVLGLEPIEEVEEEPEPAPVPEPVEEEDVEEELDQKSFDLLALNKAVACGDIEQAIAINIVAKFLKIEQVEAKKLVTHKKEIEVKQLEDLPSIPKEEIKCAEKCMECGMVADNIEGKCSKCQKPWNPDKSLIGDPLPELEDPRPLDPIEQKSLDKPMMESRRICKNDENSCQECMDQAALGWQSINTLKDIGDCTCRGNCRCTTELR